MDKNKLLEAIKEFDKKKAIVLGDIALDKYVYGKVERVNPENPGAPLLKIERKEFRLGCAANVALNISSLKAKASICGIIGRDGNSRVVQKLAKMHELNLFYLRDGATIVKERSIESEFNQYLLRADDGEFSLKDLSEIYQKRLINFLQKNKSDVIILSDYNKHLFRNNFAKKVIAFAKEKNIPVVVDPKPVNALSFQYATLICPNLKEAKEIARSNSEEPRFLARRLKEVVKSEYVVVTCGKRGMVCYDGMEFTEIPTKVREVVDVTGAGDTVCSVLGLGLASGLDLVGAAHLANYAAGVVVEKQGTSTVNQEELIKRIQED